MEEITTLSRVEEKTQWTIDLLCKREDLSLNPKNPHKARCGSFARDCYLTTVT